MSLRTKFILLILAVSALIALALLTLLYVERSTYESTLLNEQLKSVDTIGELIKQRFESYESDIQVLSVMPPVQDLDRALRSVENVDTSDDASLQDWKDRLTQIFYEYAKTRPQYTQLRLLDVEGRELIRVNNTHAGTFIVPEDQLQNKSDRYYVQQIKLTEPGEVYFSELDFNEENGLTVMPHEPTIRLGKPLYSTEDNTLFGMLILNVDANDFLSIVDESGAQNTGIEFLLDDEGFFLINKENQDLNFNRTKNGVASKVFLERRSLYVKDKLGYDEVSEIPGSKLQKSVFEFHKLISYNDTNYFVFLRYIDTSNFFSDTNKKVLIILSSWGVFLLLSSFAIYFFFIRKMIQRIKGNVDAISRITKGDYQKQVEVVGNDEISGVAAGINQLQVELRKHETELLENQSLLEKKAFEFEQVNASLKSTQRAMLNILEDLKGEKEVVERRILERTQELGQEKEKLSHITENMLTGAILLDTNAQFVFANSQVYKILEVTNKEENLLSTFFHISENVNIFESIEECRTTGKTITLPSVERNKIIYEVSIKYLSSIEERKTIHFGFLVLIRDVTDERIFERSKSELVAVASHQLRTPLTAMRGNVEMLVDESFGELNEGQKEILNDIEMSTIRLISMVNDMLDITKIEGGTLDMNLEFLDAQDIINSVLADLSEYAKRHEFTIKHIVPEDCKTILYADAVRIRQVFQNLIDNAIKYSVHPGVLEITYVCTDRAVEIMFKDNGIGMPKAEQPKMFDRFYRASNTSKTTSSGSGLGLYIVKSIVEQLGGNIRFESEEGNGTTFFVVLPNSEKAISNK